MLTSRLERIPCSSDTARGYRNTLTGTPSSRYRPGAVVIVRCEQCGAAGDPREPCSSCGVSGIPRLAPNASGGFDPSTFAELAELEDGSFWFRARSRVVLWALATWFSGARSFLEVGCGTGYVLRSISETYPTLDLFAVDLHTEGLEFARRRVPGARFAQADARDLPFTADFDVVGAFDVIEHVEEDVAVLTSIRTSVRPGGGVVLTVPQHPSIWSDLMKPATMSAVTLEENSRRRCKTPAWI